MYLDKYLDNLPVDVLLNGQFCVTLKGDKQPYDPIKGYAISAIDPFYSLEELIAHGIDDYETLGLKVANGISVIDLDDCVKNGELNDVATAIIQYMQSYTELSPSGKGIRILFSTKTPFNIKTHKTKNSKLGIEYYDAHDQETRGGRMCRLSGDRIMTYEFREVDTQAFLDQYMVRAQIEAKEMFEAEVNKEWCEIVHKLIKHRSDVSSLLQREVTTDESSIDLILCNMIAEYTQNFAEIKTIFEMTNFYKTKGIKSSKAKHRDKWDSDYGWNTVMMSNPNIVRLHSRPDRKFEPSIVFMIAVAIKYELTKESYFKKFKIDWTKVNAIIDSKDQAFNREEIETDALYVIHRLGVIRLQLKDKLIELLEDQLDVYLERELDIWL